MPGRLCSAASASATAHVGAACAAVRVREIADAILKAMVKKFMAGVVVSVVAVVASADAQQPVIPDHNPEKIPTTPAAVAKLGPGLFRIGEIKVDTTKREASVSGKVNAVEILEFVANTQGGLKAYESALTIDTNAVTFNAAMLMIGLDKEIGRVDV